MNAPETKFEPPALDAAWLGDDPIPAKPYYDPDWFAEEVEAIFKRTWLQAGHISEVAEPGDYIRREFEFANASILIVRGKDGALRGFHNVCTHRATQLVTEEAGQANGFTCPYHAWNFGLEGELKSAPDFDRFNLTKEDCALKPVSVDVCGGFVFVNLDPSPDQSLEEFLGEMAPMLEAMPATRATTFSEYVYDIDANWKMTFDNFQESYHLRFIHPKSGLATFSQDNPFGYPAAYGFHGPHRTQRIWTNPKPNVKPVQMQLSTIGARKAMAQGTMPADNNRDYLILFPNFFLLGTPTQHFSHTVYPVSATKSRGVIRIYWIDQDDSASTRLAREYALATVRDIHAEDVDVILRGQRGLNSGCLEHIHFQELEGLCRHLYLMVEERVLAWRKENGR